ncbi:MAG: flippase-like domain-containing protein [Acidobacteria bacterium]|nr:flippase-like domain-containing protein [Acidobacteriota bacterium]
MSHPSRTSRIPWSGLVITALTAGLVWLFVRDLDAAALRQAFASAHLGLVALAVLTTLQTYFIRAWRWQTLLRPIGVVPFRSAFRATVIGFTAIFLLPARVGEVLRPYLLAKQENLSVSATFATVILERALDLTAVLLLFAGALPFMPVDVAPEVRAGGAAAAAASLTGLVMLFMFARHPERLGQLVDRLSAWLPTRAAQALGAFARKFAAGLAVMRDGRALLVTLAWSLALWISICAGIWLVSRAFGLTVPFTGAFLVVMYLVVGVAAPTPGGAGAFHVMYKLAVMQNFGAQADDAAAAAIFLHLVSFAPVALLGFVFMWQDGLTLGRLRHMAPSPEEETHA